MKTKKLFLTLLASAALAACSAYGTCAAVPAMLSDGALTASNGMTLYVFDKDAAGSGKSLCNGPCATNWPPLMAMDSDTANGDYSIIIRDDGKKQWAFKGKPLYFWSKDMKAGDKAGDGFNNVWHVARP
jgi:predicted lipoprotein with Yx(FWY)xxD motif